jgi:hypothetical protein
MKGVWLFAIGAVCGVAAMALPKAAAHLHAALRGGHASHDGSGDARVHTEEKFAFTANSPMSEVAPLFGAEKERVWAPNWNPQFVHPLPAADEEGMVFSVAHDHLRSVWVNTVFDEKNGRIQYVYVIPDALATVITLQLTPQSDGMATLVEVQYDRTALSAEADEHVRLLADGDRRSGLEWEKQVNDYLASNH